MKHCTTPLDTTVSKQYCLQLYGDKLNVGRKPHSTFTQEHVERTWSRDTAMHIVILGFSTVCIKTVTIREMYLSVGIREM